jgi:glycosyltransferase involved in cell wall biosynthesis
MSDLYIVISNDFGHVNGGAAQVALSSAIALARRGLSVTAFVAVPPVTPDLGASGVRVVCTEQHDILSDPDRRRAAVKGIWNRNAARMMGSLLASLPPARTVVHVHGWTKALSSSIVQAAITGGFKVICTLHDYFAACPNGSFFNYPHNHICHLRAMSVRCLASNCDVRSYHHKLWRVARQAVQQTVGRTPRGISAFIALSRLSRDVLVPYLPKGARVYQVENPIDVPKGEPARVGENDAFVAVGRLASEKGPHLFATAAAQLRARAVFIGDGPQRAEVATICPAMEITGWQPHAEVLAQMRRARALVFPSVWYEAQPLVVLEAAALGLPAIVADTCAARDMVADGETGLWFTGGDAADLAERMSRLTVPGTAEMLGRAAYERYWAAPPTLERHIQRLLEVYEDVLAF